MRRKELQSTLNGEHFRYPDLYLLGREDSVYNINQASFRYFPFYPEDILFLYVKHHCLFLLFSVQAPKTEMPHTQ